MTITQPEDFEFTSELPVHAVSHLASDVDVVAAAQVSTKGDRSLGEYLDTDGSPMNEERLVKLIDFLLKNRHGTPFEHNYFRYFVSAPIAVFREYHRHRIGFSYNEESGRYTKLKPRFYIPPKERPLVQTGPPGRYVFVPGTDEQWERQVDRIERSCRFVYREYEEALDDGIAKEVARGVLPVYIFSSMWVSCNARSIMSFLSLRSTGKGYVDFFGEEFEDPADPMFPSFPMWEIERVALQMEKAFAEAMPITHAAFRRYGSVSP